METKSKTRLKKEMHELQTLGKKLVELSVDRIKSIDMPEKLIEAVLFAKTISKHGALKRQLHYIGAIMRDVDAEPIQQALETDEEARISNVRLFKKAELWRDALVDGDEGVLNEIFSQFPHADHQQIRQLMRNAQKEKLAGKAPKSSRNLFRALKELLDNNP